MDRIADRPQTKDMTTTHLIIGGSGNVGRALSPLLVQAGDRVRSATRNPATAKVATGVEPVRFDYEDSLTFGPALDGADTVFVICPAIAEPHHLVLPFLAEAAQGGRKIVLMTAMGVEHEEEGSLRKIERALEASGSPFVILRPNWFMDNFHGMWLPSIEHADVVAVPSADAASSFIDARDIAASAAAALCSNRFDGQAFTLTGPEALTYEQATAILAEQTGATIRYQPIDDETFVAALSSAGVPEDLARFLAGLFGFVRLGATAEVSGAVEQLTGRAPRTLKQYARDHASAWTPAAVS